MENEEEAEYKEKARRRVIPYEPPLEKPVQLDTELSKDLMKVSGSTTRQRVLVPVKKDDGTILGYEVREVPNLFYETISEDMTKANLNDMESKIVRGQCFASNYTQAISHAFKQDLSPIQKMLADDLLAVLTSSRAKGGFNAWLSKTDKTISQTSMEQLSKQMTEEKKARWKFW